MGISRYSSGKGALGMQVGTFTMNIDESDSLIEKTIRPAPSHQSSRDSPETFQPMTFQQCRWLFLHMVWAFASGCKRTVIASLQRIMSRP